MVISYKMRMIPTSIASVREGLVSRACVVRPSGRNPCAFQRGETPAGDWLNAAPGAKGRSGTAAAPLQYDLREDDLRDHRDRKDGGVSNRRQIASCPLLAERQDGWLSLDARQ